MTTYYGSARTNYFKVADTAAFISALGPFNVEVEVEVEVEVCGSRTDVVKVVADENGFVDGYFDPSTKEWVEASVTDVIAAHLVDGWVCVMEEVGTESLRYLHGRAVAFNNQGGKVSIDLRDIYSLAGRLGPHLTRAEE